MSVMETEHDGQAAEGGLEVEGAGEGDVRVERARQFGAGDPGREALAHVAQGAALDDQEEEYALEYLLGSKPAIRYEIPVTYATDKGMLTVLFLTRAADTTRIDKIEERNYDEKSGRIDRLAADCEVVAHACYALKAGGRVLQLDSDEFLTMTRPSGERQKVADPAMVIKMRFADQLGLINGVATEIKRTCGFSPERVKSAKRVLEAASLD